MFSSSPRQWGLRGFFSLRKLSKVMNRINRYLLRHLNYSKKKAGENHRHHNNYNYYFLT